MHNKTYDSKLTQTKARFTCNCLVRHRAWKRNGRILSSRKWISKKVNKQGKKVSKQTFYIVRQSTNESGHITAPGPILNRKNK